jgi:hypothetical protein
MKQTGTDIKRKYVYIASRLTTRGSSHHCVTDNNSHYCVTDTSYHITASLTTHTRKTHRIGSSPRTIANSLENTTAPSSRMPECLRLVHEKG